MISPDSIRGHRVVTPFPRSRLTGRLPDSWPLPDDFPIVTNEDGKIVTRYGDTVWNFAPWAGRALTASFGDSESSVGARIDAENAALFRQLAAWWIFGPGGLLKASTIVARHSLFKTIFAVCSREKILASDLWRYPRVIEEVACRVTKSETSKIISHLHEVWTCREEIGFFILDDLSLRLFGELLPRQAEQVQAAYIPPRIWSYQVLRLRECLDDFVHHREAIERCYEFCLDAYAHNAGGYTHLFDWMPQYHKPFDPKTPCGVSADGRKHLGPFFLTAEHFGVEAVLQRWVGLNRRSGIRIFSKYLSLISSVGLAYVLNFSLMRISEGMGLRAGCFASQEDDLGDEVCLLEGVPFVTGVTSKTMQESSARWIVSPSCSVAIEAMTVVAELRLRGAQLAPTTSGEDYETPLLAARPHEPWIPDGNAAEGVRKKERSYSELIGRFPRLFDLEVLRIRPDDLACANQLTLGLDPGVFRVGEVWPLSWHQLRRTGACNMLASGVVSETSLQYQLKHLTVAMSRYYGQRHYNLNVELCEEARGFYVREMYDSLARSLEGLQDERHISPHGEKRKAQIIQPISESDHRRLVADGAAGRVSYRETFFGGCAKPGAACPLGGISNVTGCMGYGAQLPCEWVLLNRERRPLIARLRASFEQRLMGAADGSPLASSLKASIESADRAINVIDAI